VIDHDRIGALHERRRKQRRGGAEQRGAAGGARELPTGEAMHFRHLCSLPVVVPGPRRSVLMTARQAIATSVAALNLLRRARASIDPAGQILDDSSRAFIEALCVGAGGVL